MEAALAQRDAMMAERDARIVVLTRRVTELRAAAEEFADVVEAAVVGRSGQTAALAAGVLESVTGQAAG